MVCLHCGDDKPHGTTTICKTMGKLCPIKFLEEISMDKTQEFYSYHYKEKKGGLSPEEKKRRNDLAYELAMRGKNKDPKGYALASIGVAYEDVRNYKNSAKMNMEELRWRASEFMKRMRHLAAAYGLTGDEVREYFARRNYSLSF